MAGKLDGRLEDSVVFTRAYSIVALLMFVSCAQAPAHGADCTTGPQVINDAGKALAAVERGEDKIDVLNDLLCFATTTRGRGAVAAVNAVMGLTESDELARQYLIGIVKSPDTTLEVCYRACELLVYCADEDTAGFLLDELASGRSERNWPALYRALRDLGDMQFLAWLEETGGQRGGRPLPGGYVEGDIQLLKALRKPEDLLSLFEADDKKLDRPWILKQVARLGVSREQIRSMVLLYLRKTRFKEDHHVVELVYLCDEWRLLSGEERAEFSGLLGLLKSSNRGCLPFWCGTKITAEKNRYWGVDRLLAASAE